MTKILVCAVVCLLVIPGCGRSCRSTKTTTVTVEAPLGEQVEVKQVQYDTEK